MALKYNYNEIGLKRQKLDNTSTLSSKCDKIIDVFAKLVTTKHS